MLPAAPYAQATPDRTFQYLYVVKTHRYYFGNDADALAFGWGACDKMAAGVGYAQLVRETRFELNADEGDANFLVGTAAGMLCQENIYQLRKSAEGYKPPPGDEYYIGPPSYPGGQGGSINDHP